MATIAFIVLDSGSPSAVYETPFYDRMTTTLGHTVNYVDDSAAESYDYSSTDVIVISSLIGGSAVDGLKSEAIPIITGSKAHETEFSLGTGNDSDADDKINIIDNSHYITQNESTGNLVVYSSSSDIYLMTGWSNDVNDLAQEQDDATRAAILDIDKDETLVDSSTAAERRVFFGISKANKLNSDGWDIFDRTLGWCLYEDSAAESGSDDLSANVTIQNESQAEFSANFTLQNEAQDELSVNATIQNEDQYDLSANTTIQNQTYTELSGNVTVQNEAQDELSANATIQNESYIELSANFTVQIGESVDLSANLTVRNKSQAELSSNLTIAQESQVDLSANFVLGGDYGYVELGDSQTHLIPLSWQTQTIEISNSVHQISLSAATHTIAISTQTHTIVLSSEPLT